MKDLIHLTDEVEVLRAQKEKLKIHIMLPDLSWQTRMSMYKEVHDINEKIMEILSGAHSE